MQGLRKVRRAPLWPPSGTSRQGRTELQTLIDFTRKDDTLYAIFLEWPQAESALTSLGKNALPDSRIDRIDLLILHQALPGEFDLTVAAYKALEQRKGR